MDGTGFHRDGPPFEHEACRLHEGSAARHLVVDDEGDFPLDVADQIRGPQVLVVPVAPFVHDRDRQVQAVRVLAHLLRLAHVAGDEPVICEVTALTQVVAQDRGGLELVGRDTEEALHPGASAGSW